MDTEKMGSNLKNFLFADSNWLVEMSAEETASLEQYLNDGDGHLHEHEHDFKLPGIIGILPIRNAVAYPGTVTPLAIGRKKSKALLEDVKPNETIIGLITQHDPEIDDPDFHDIYSIGTAASVLKIVKMPQGSMHIVVHGIARFKIVQPIAIEPYLKAGVQPLKVTAQMSKKLQALIVNIREAANRVIKLSPNVPEEASVLLENIENPSALADFLAANITLSIPKKQQLLQELDAVKRLEKISVALANQLEVLELSHKIQSRVRESIDKSQRDYFLHEQLKAIQSELGEEGDRKTEELKQIAKNIKKAKMPKKIETEALRELDRLSKIPPVSPEHSVIRTYLDWVCELPWSTQTEDQLDINKAERILNRDHYNLRKVKSPILCFVGPPGVGKTSLGRSIARAMGRKFIRISLGGIRDEADIRGHRRTYIGALPGRILQELRKCGSKNPVFMLDELDKIGQDFRGDPASALLEVLDPEQNFSFTDHYLDEPFDLSTVMFIGTANYAEPVPPALRDRMELIELPGYTENEKLNIEKR